jgi:hypothetical protein
VKFLLTSAEPLFQSRNPAVRQPRRLKLLLNLAKFRWCLQSLAFPTTLVRLHTIPEWCNHCFAFCTLRRKLSVW